MNLALTLDPRRFRVNGAPTLWDESVRRCTYAGAVPSVLNVSAYLFTRIDDPHSLRPVLRDRATASGLKGTILLAEEGVNLFLAGATEPLRRFIGELRREPGFSRLMITQKSTTGTKTQRSARPRAMMGRIRPPRELTSRRPRRRAP